MPTEPIPTFTDDTLTAEDIECQQWAKLFETRHRQKKAKPRANHRPGFVMRVQKTS